MRGGFRMMSQCLADDGDRDIVVSCRRCPGMTGDIEGELALDAYLSTKLPEMVGDTGFCIVIQAHLFLLFVNSFVMAFVSSINKEREEIR